MLFRDVTGAGGRGSINCAHLPGGSSPRADYAGPSGAPGALLSSPPSPGPEWCSEGAGPHGSAPDSATPPDHADDLAADSPAGLAAGNVGGLPGGAGVGGRDCLLFGFFRAGEITVPTTSAFDAATHLSWGDVAIDVTGMALRVFLKRSKTDQYGRGTEVFLGATGNDLCPVEAVRAYVANRGAAPGAFFCAEGGAPLTKARFVELVRGRPSLELAYRSRVTPDIASGSVRPRQRPRPGSPIQRYKLSGGGQVQPSWSTFGRPESIWRSSRDR